MCTVNLKSESGDRVSHRGKSGFVERHQINKNDLQSQGGCHPFIVTKSDFFPDFFVEK